MFGQTVSSVGDQVFPVAVTLHVLDNGGTVGDLGLSAARTGALVLFALLGGVWADRLPRVRLLVGADALRLVAVLGLVLLMTGTTSVPLLAALVFLVGAGEAFFRPAFGTLIPQVLPPEELNAGNALWARRRSGSPSPPRSLRRCCASPCAECSGSGDRTITR